MDVFVLIQHLEPQLVTVWGVYPSLAAAREAAHGVSRVEALDWTDLQTHTWVASIPPHAYWKIQQEQIQPDHHQQ